MNAAGRGFDFGRVVAYHPALAAPLGGVKAALLFCQLYYWHKKSDDPRGVYKSRQDLELETGLTYREQRHARKALTSRGVLEEHHDYSNHQVYFRINFEKLAQRMNWPQIEAPPEWVTKRHLPCPECEKYMTKRHPVGDETSLSTCRNVNYWLPKRHSLLYKITKEITPIDTHSAPAGAPVAVEKASVTEVTHETAVAPTNAYQAAPQKPRKAAGATAQAEKARQRKADIEAVFQYWQRVMKHPDAKLTDDRRRKINARLAEGYTPAALCAAVDGCAASPHHMGENDTGTRYDSIGLIFRSGEKTEWFAAKRRKPPAEQGGEGPHSAVGRFMAGDDIEGGTVIEGGLL